ncbi:unnamed protein product [Sphenostylis stenocarpa]|uniref:Uncharacterized protein n=1 Tax=Sphenostylis stenocarpa TaxID=92480 RepID=A0AA86VVL9_9FABA|nr:unnamed protein product [Sphenostylis stenocarpa]
MRLRSVNRVATVSHSAQILSFYIKPSEKRKLPRIGITTENMVQLFLRAEAKEARFCALHERDHDDDHVHGAKIFGSLRGSQNQTSSADDLSVALPCPHQKPLRHTFMCSGNHFSRFRDTLLMRPINIDIVVIYKLTDGTTVVGKSPTFTEVSE